MPTQSTTSMQKNKGITTIQATIVLILISLTAAAFVYAWFSGVLRTAGSIYTPPTGDWCSGLCFIYSNTTSLSLDITETKNVSLVIKKSGPGTQTEVDYILRWIEDFRNSEAPYNDGYGVGYVSGVGVMDVNSEIHPLVVLAKLDYISGGIGPELESSINYSVNHFFDSSTGGMYEWPEGNITDEWTDATSFVILTLIKSYPERYSSVIRKSLEFLLFMKKPDSPLFYDYYNISNGRREAYLNPPTVGILDDAQVYRSAWAAIALIEGYKLFKDVNSTFAEELKNAAIDLQNWEQNTDGSWNSTYNHDSKHRTVKDNALMVLYLLSLQENGFVVSRSKIDSTVNWILSMQDSSNYGFHSTKELDVIYPAEYSDHNALGALAIKKYDDTFFDVNYFRQLNNWRDFYIPLILDNSQYGTPTKWSFRNDITDTTNNRFVYVNALYALAFLRLGYEAHFIYQRPDFVPEIGIKIYPNPVSVSGNEDYSNISITGLILSDFPISFNTTSINSNNNLDNSTSQITIYMKRSEIPDTGFFGIVIISIIASMLLIILQPF